MRSLSSVALATAFIALSAVSLNAQGGPSVTVQRQPISGQITAINHFTGQVTVRTQEIPGLEGKSMTVAYMPPDAAALKALQEGDHVKGELVIEGSDTHMENVVAVGTTKNDTVEKTPTGKKKSGTS